MNELEKSELEAADVAYSVPPMHEQLADIMLMEPHLERGQIAARLGRSVQWIDTILRSDLFQAYYAERREQVNQVVAQELAGLAQGVARKGMVELNRRFSDPVKLQNYAMKEVREVTKMAMGFGTEPVHGRKGVGGNSPAPLVNINILSSALDRARERMQKISENNTRMHGGDVIDAEPSVD